MNYKAEWSGCYPCLCYGTWTLFKDGEDVSEYEDIYEAFKEEDFVMGSCGGCI